MQQRNTGAYPGGGDNDVSFSGVGKAAEIRSIDEIFSLFSPAMSIAERVETTARELIGTPYISEFSDDILLNGFDCLTFVETVCAVALSKTASSFPATLRRIRYYRATPSVSTRKHFVSADWLPDNRWFLTPLDGQTARANMCISRENYWEKIGAALPEWLAREEVVSLSYVPKGDRVVCPEGGAALAFFVGSEKWLIVTHTGIVVREVLYHSSLAAKEVVAEPLWEYIKRRDSIKGVSLWQIDNEGEL